MQHIFQKVCTNLHSPQLFFFKHCLTQDNTFLLQDWGTKEESSYQTCHWNPGDPGDMAWKDGLRCAAHTQEAVGSAHEPALFPPHLHTHPVFLW